MQTLVIIGNILHCLYSLLQTPAVMRSSWIWSKSPESPLSTWMLCDRLN